MILSFIVLLVLLDRRQLFGTKGRLVVVLVVYAYSVAMHCTAARLSATVKST